jgi:hypothetical protein
MDIVSVCHESRRQRDDVRPVRATAKIQEEIYILARIDRIAMLVEVYGDVAVPGGELGIQVYESRAKPLG